MAYTTLNTQNKRNQLKTQLDDFATFQWRGHHMFDDFGCFIINEQKGSLKFYNGPGFTNQYAKTQFSSSVNTLLGVDFKQQIIPMKVGLYWFTIKEYQEFLQCIGPYQVNYITFDFDDKYGYLVKSGNITDSTKHIIGTDENGEKRYYTELDLTWEVLGDSCVRSNLAYEYDAIIKTENNKNICEWNAKTDVDMTDTSLLDTPFVFEIPCCFTKPEVSLQLDAILPSATIVDSKTGKKITLEGHEQLLYNIQLQALTTSGNTLDQLNATYGVDLNIQNQLTKTSLYCCQQGVFDGSLENWLSINIETYEPGEYEGYTITERDGGDGIDITFPNYILVQVFGQTATETQSHISFGEYAVHFDTGTISIFNINKLEPSDIQPYVLLRESINDIVDVDDVQDFAVQYEGNYFDKIVYANTFLLYNEAEGNRYCNIMLFNSTTNDWIVISNSSRMEVVAQKNKIDESLHSYLTFQRLYFSEAWHSDTPLYQLYLRYDSETGLIYIQSGSQTSWRLLNYQTDNTNGQSLLNSLQSFKYKIPGEFNLPDRKTTEWKFRLTYDGIDLDVINQNQLNQAITMYSRKNVI